MAANDDWSHSRLLSLFRSSRRLFSLSFYLFFLLSLSSLPNGASAKVFVNSTQAGILLRVAKALNSTGDDLFSSWDRKKPCEKWLGLKCDSKGNAVSLVLSSQDVIYKNFNFSRTLGNSYFDYDGDYSAPFGSLMGIISPEIGRLTSLKHLILKGQSIQGGIPKEVGKLKNLLLLDLGNNALSGKIPSSIGNLTNLQYLNLEENYDFEFDYDYDSSSLLVLSLNGTLPDEIGNLAKLEYLNLGSCKFIGTPSGLKRLKNLRILILSYNGFGGDLNSFLGTFPEIVTLDLGNNNFSGSIPPLVGTYKNLTNLNLQNCSFSGSIPDTIFNLVNLEVLRLTNNLFHGEIPLAMKKLTNLVTLFIGSNKFAGTFPNLNSTKLRTLDLSKNNFTGTLSDTIFGSPHLYFMDLSGNHFSGTLADGIFRSPDLFILDLSGNNFTGTLPDGIFRLSRLDTLNLSGNNFVGTLPGGTLRLSNLYILDLSGNNFTGTLPGGIFHLPNLSMLDLSNNNFIGKITKPINISANSHVNISNNLLTGVVNIIYEDWYYRESLIDIKNNYFSGYFINNKQKNSPSVSENGNCIKNVGVVKFFNQKSSTECKKFCNAYQVGGSCGPKGVCTPTSFSTVKCICDKGLANPGNSFTCKAISPPPKAINKRPPPPKFHR